MPDPKGPHHLTDLHRRHVAAAGVHPRAHGRVDGQVVDLYDEFSLGCNRFGLIDDRPIARLGHVYRACGQPTLSVGNIHEAASLAGELFRQMSAAQPNAVRPPGSSAVTGITATVSAPACRYSRIRPVTCSGVPMAASCLANSSGIAAAMSDRRAPPRARSTSSANPSSHNISP